MRNFSNLAAKSFYLDLVFRGNDKLNFANRFTDRDVILLSSALEGQEKVTTLIGSLFATSTSPTTKSQISALRSSPSILSDVPISLVSICRATI